MCFAPPRPCFDVVGSEFRVTLGPGERFMGERREQEMVELGILVVRGAGRAIYYELVPD